MAFPNAGGKIVLIFNNLFQPPAGFSEVFYSIFPELQALQSLALNLATLRASFLSGGWAMVGARISAVQPRIVGGRNQRLSQFIPFTQVGVFSPLQSSDFPATGVLTKLSSQGGLAFSMRTIRGVPDDFFKNNSSQIPAGWVSAAKLFWLSAASVGVGFRHKVVGNPNPTVALVDRLDVVRSGARKPGRPFGSLRGRRFAHHHSGS